MWRNLVNSVLITLTVVIMTSCSDDDCPTCPQPTTQVTGQLLAYFCGIDDAINNSGDLRYSVRTGRPAYVTLTHLNGRSHTFTTDDSSSFDLFLDKGVYEISVSADYVLPVIVGDIEISGDTAVDLKVVYDFYTDDHYLFGNFYYSDGDSIGQTAELAALSQLNGSSGNVIDFAAAERLRVSQIGPAIHISYRLPIYDQYLNWQADDSLSTELTANGGDYPSELSIDPGYYICQY